MVAGPRLAAGIVASLLPVVALVPGPALAATPASAGQTSGVPSAAQRIAATNATFSAIEAKIAAGESLQTNFDDPTAQEDVIDYGVNDLWKKGIDGAGVTVAYVVGNPDPGLQDVMASYDTMMHLPPAHITELALPPPADPAAASACPGGCETGEDHLDAEAIHSMAPYANIVFVHPSMPEAIGMQGWPQVAQAIEMIANRHLANVISVSLDDAEKNFRNDPASPGASQSAAIHSLDPALLDAAAHSIPVTFAAGDCGPTDPPFLFSTGQCTPAIGVTAGHPVDSPWVTAVGGTVPNPGLATPEGRTAPDGLWTAQDGDGDAAGAGVSTVYPKPSWQMGIPALKGVTGRAYPDISMDASDGTSQASPTFAGILALATQEHHGDLGPVNPALAALGPHGKQAGIIDVPAGYTNSAYGVTGYATAAGYDIASGWGTIYAPAFVPALVKQISSQHGASQPSRQAAGLLRQLQSRISRSAATVTSGQKVTVTGKGFIPGRSPNGTTIRDGYGIYPPIFEGLQASVPVFAHITSKVPGQTWDHVTATLTRRRMRARSLAVTGPDNNGTVRITISTRGLAAGTYKVTIKGMLLTQTTTFQVKNG